MAKNKKRPRQRTEALISGYEEHAPWNVVHVLIAAPTLKGFTDDCRRQGFDILAIESLSKLPPGVLP